MLVLPDRFRLDRVSAGAGRRPKACPAPRSSGPGLRRRGGGGRAGNRPGRQPDRHRGGRPPGTCRTQRAGRAGTQARLAAAGRAVRHTMILVLMAAAVVAAVIGDLKDTIVILAIVVLNAVVDFVQEYRAEQAMAAGRSAIAEGDAAKAHQRLAGYEPSRGMTTRDRPRREQRVTCAVRQPDARRPIRWSSPGWGRRYRAVGPRSGPSGW
jgi:uncharacterized MAPEG superfamily protein